MAMKEITIQVRPKVGNSYYVHINVSKESNSAEEVDKFIKDNLIGVDNVLFTEQEF